MIEQTTDDWGPWQPGEFARYQPCATHAGALSRLGDFDRELDVAEACKHCRVQYRTAARADA